MNKILLISGSSRNGSTNTAMLKWLVQELIPPEQSLFYDLHKLPLFHPDRDQSPWPEDVLAWRKTVSEARAVIISTPAYLKNLPAGLKNALEWLSSSGEMQHKPVLPITLTPHPPRGEQAMQSLVWTLGAMQAQIVAQLPLYLSDFESVSPQMVPDMDTRAMLEAGIALL